MHEMKEARFIQVKSTFSMVCRVEISIQAKAEVIWALLTDANGFPRWNSTITRIEGQIREGERLRLHVPGTKQTFKPKVSGVVPNERMIWSNGYIADFQRLAHFHAQSARRRLIRIS